ncbi:hypothetical protein VINI7043_14360 [Vibrio nigripulchritudo ATCC 27043]|nr:hypothetical protein VINI7043_14360 [Vibrio nigripulchritudo ATCC 27043]
MILIDEDPARTWIFIVSQQQIYDSTEPTRAANDTLSTRLG